MHKLPVRLALSAALVLFSLSQAEAARISISSTADQGGGTIINDGSADVSSSNGSSSGFTNLLSELGIHDLTLGADLAQLHVVGTVGIPDATSGPAVVGNLNGLKIYGTVDDPANCPNCALLSQVHVGGSLHQGPNGDVANVLFVVNLVGGVANNTPWFGPLGGPAQPNPQFGAQLDFQLSQAQIGFIMSRLTAGGFGVGDVHIGLGALVAAVTADQQPLGSAFETVGPTAVPEPATMMLLASGLASLPAAIRRRRKTRY
jgi:hypothetical protein